MARNIWTGNEESDLPDANTWITKMLLLGGELLQHSEHINDNQWRYTAIVHTKGTPYSTVQADWPGRCARMYVQRKLSDLAREAAD